MKGSIREYSQLGLAHFMFWPDCLRKTSVLTDSLVKLSQRPEIDAIDCCMPFDPAARQKLASALRASGKRLGYAIHPFPLDKIGLGSTMDHEQGLARLVIADQLDAAAQIGASTFTIASGIDPGPELRPRAKAAFADFCTWLAPLAEARGMTVLLEPFDRTFHRKFLFGPTAECVELIEMLRPGVRNLCIQLDAAHVRLSGEDFAAAVRQCGPHLGHVHLGNCVMKNPSDPFYGDRHPPISYPGGEIDENELTSILRTLLSAGYLNTQHRPTLVIEAQPFAGWTPQRTIEHQLKLLDSCWAEVQG